MFFYMFDCDLASSALASYDFRASVDGLEPPSWPMLAVLAALGVYVGSLGLSWGLCGRSGAGLRSWLT